MKTTRVLVGLLLLLAPLPAAAQTVRAQLVESGSGRPVAGAMLLLESEAGARVAGGLSDATGHVTLRAPSPGPYRLRAQRVGYESTLTPVFELTAGMVAEGPLQVTPTRTALDGITVEARPRCEVRPAVGQATAVLWDEARKALDAASFALEGELYQYRVRRTVRTLAPGTLSGMGRLDDLAAVGQETVEGVNVTARPFASVPAERLMERGFIEEANGDAIYHAPDADVLLSDPFLDGYCFQVASDPERPALVGLAFRPVSRSGPAGVVGTLWLDRASKELRHLDYQYTRTRLGEQVERELGGRVEFEALPNGAWIVRRWRLRMPTQITTQRQEGRLGAQMSSRLTGVREEGGEVMEILAGSGAVARTTLAGVVYDSIRGTPLAEASVFVSGTQYSTMTDLTGAYRIEGIPPGEVAVSFTHPSLSKLGIFTPPASVVLKPAETTLLDMALTPGAELDAARRACPDHDPAVTRAFVGRMEEPMTSRGLSGVEMRLSWAGSPAPGLTVQSGAEGRYVACGLPRDRPVAVQIRREGAVVIQDTVPAVAEVALAARDYVVGIAQVAARPVLSMRTDRVAGPSVGPRSDRLLRSDFANLRSGDMLGVIRNLRPSWVRVRANTLPGWARLGASTLGAAAAEAGPGSSLPGAAADAAQSAGALGSSGGVNGDPNAHCWMEDARCLDGSASQMNVIVYVDGVRMTADQLRDIAPAEVVYVQYFDPIAASSRWGFDHSRGALYISTRDELCTGC